MLRCIILDDEPLAVRLLKDYVSKTPGLELIEAGGDAFKSLELVQAGKADLILLDIQMPELTGVQFMKIIQKKCKVILTTAYEEYALQGFEHDVVDYLLKPISLERFMIAVEKVKERMKIPAPVADNNTPGFIFIKSEYRIHKIDLHDILLLEGLRDYIAVHTADNKIMTLQSMHSFEELLPPSQFMRVHKSYLIRLDKISHIERGRITIGKHVVPIGEKYREGFMKQLNLPG
ncbi:MAG TPA: LytTR family DNA-binding domain-containing protein [Chitinophagaceae bacterium]|nr:LytTR family DNA-binding domain-containing protein [Chitinophagaceae bacterium]